MITVIMASQRLKTFHIGSSESFLSYPLPVWIFLKQEERIFEGKKFFFFEENGYAKESLGVSTRRIIGEYVEELFHLEAMRNRNDLNNLLLDHVVVGFAL